MSLGLLYVVVTIISSMHSNYKLISQILLGVAWFDRLQSVAVVLLHSNSVELLGNHSDDCRALHVAMAMVTGRDRERHCRERWTEA